MNPEYVINVFGNRQIQYDFDTIQCGSVNENNATKLIFNLNFEEIDEINVSNFSMYLDVDTLTSGGKFVVPVTNNEVSLTTAITQYEKLKGQLVMEYESGNTHIIFKSKTFDLYLNKSVNASTPVDEGDIITLGSLSDKVDGLQDNLSNVENTANEALFKANDMEKNLINYSLVSETGNQIELTLDNDDFKMTAILKDKDGKVINESNVIDLPLEQLVMDIEFNDETKELVITLENGQTTKVPIAHIVDGLVNEEEFSTYKAQVTQSIDGIDERVTNNSNSISGLYTSLNSTNENVSNNTTNITTLNGKVSNIETEIGDVQSILATLTTVNGGDE